MATPRQPTNPPTTQAPTSNRQGSATAATTTTATIRTTPSNAVPSATGTTTTTISTRPTSSNAASSATATTITTVSTRPTPSNAAPPATTTTTTIANRPIQSSAVPSSAGTTTAATRPTPPTAATTATPPTATVSAPSAATSNATTLLTVTPSAAGTSETQKPTNAAQADLQKVSLVSTKSQFDIKIAEAGNKLVIVEFFAQWCGPCKIIGNKLEELAGKYENQAIVLKLDVDDCEDIAMEYNVTSMPTFVFLRNKKKINELIGSSDEKLFESVDKLCNEVNSTPEFNQPTTSATNVEIRIKKTSHLSAKPAVK